MIIELLRYICGNLNKAKIDYMLSGSLAMNLYTTPRMTRDIDFVIHLELNNINRFINLFQERFYLNKDTIKEEVEKQGFFNLIDNESIYKIDFIIRKNNKYRKLEFDRRIVTHDFGFKVYVVAIEDLIISKLIWIQNYPSEKHIEDIENLLKNPNKNLIYIKKWISEFNLKTFNIKI